ncbi:MAG: HAMP domain-containing protein [Gammaproteobacteria bacterium]
MSAKMTAKEFLDTRQILKALRMYRKGDFSVRLPVGLDGVEAEIAEVFNEVVELNESMVKEFDRISNVVGKEGKISQRARLQDASGSWAACVDSVNTLIGDMVQPTTEVARVIGAVAKGDLSQVMQLEIDGRGLRGEFLRIGKVVNTMVDQLGSFASEVTRVAREVGTEGKLGGQAKVKGVGGTWKDLTDNVNFMAANLTGQVRNIAEVTTAVAKGDLSKKITVDVKGEILELKNTINTMVDQLNSFAAEVSRVAREVGTEGKLGGQAQVKGVGGTWKDLTDNVNSMANNLTGQVRNIAEVTTAVANGNLSKKITVDVKGEILELKITINTMVDQLNSFASEVTRVAREVGTEGKLGGQAQVKGVGGTWKDLTDNVNYMAANLTGQVRNIAEVTTAVAKGDLSKKITVDVKGEILELKSTINTMVDQLNSFAAEVTRVAREVGTEGKLGGQAQVKGVGGTWKDLTDNVNSMAANLTGQVRNIAEVTTAVAKGDLSKKITVDVKGEILELKNTINTMVDQLNSFAAEVSRVAREVGTEGKLGGQAQVKGVGGTWKDLTENVNFMAANLTGQVRNIAEVTTAVANGDLSKKITVDVKGEILELKDTVNTMVDQLNSFASEVTRVAREVGSDGKLGGQAEVRGVGGTWKDLTDNVNFMAGNLTGQVRNIAEVTTAVANGDLSKKITVDVKGEILELKNTVNTMVDQLNSFAAEVTRVAREVGTEGKLGGQAQVKGVAGTWKDLTDNVNYMANNLTGQVRNIAEVTTAVANGDLSKKITVDVKGEILELKNTVNTMVDQLNSFAAEVTRVAREVGTEGKLGGQAQVKGVGGTWKDLTDNVNFMAANLTGQVRNIANVVTAVANGDLKRKLAVEAKGEIAALADTINGMIETLATFADQVTNVAREVGIEGKLGGQAKVPGAAGLWRDLTDNVNQLAANLTTQVRAIAEVATAVTKGDLTRSITVEALGEVAALKDNINEMIRNLKDTTLKNTEQDWLKTNLARFTRMLQGERDLGMVSKLILSELGPLVNAHHGVFYLNQKQEDKVEPELELLASYAYKKRKNLSSRFKLGEGLVGQCAYEKERILVTNVPDDYIQVNSGLGEGTPRNIIVLPVLFEGEVKAIIELASFNYFSETHQSFLDQLMESIGIVLNTIAANMRTEDLLKQSQSLTVELQSQQEELKQTNDRLEQQAKNLQKSEDLLKSQQEELQQTNEELEEKARLLSQQKSEVESKNREVEFAKEALEEKAEQLTLTSKYKSEFLANMSHELRTPLNSLLILSKLLSDNPDNNLSPKQTEFAHTIYASGADLLSLINDILDLSKIESGTVTLDVTQERFTDMQAYVEQNFSLLAHTKGLKFITSLDKKLPQTMLTDIKRLQQILKNLLSNAFKFTEKGKVELRIMPVMEGWNIGNDKLGNADKVIAFSVTDTGIGIAPEKQNIIFEAFQQADGTTSRKYGGTGLGLSISREIAALLGGEIRVTSTPGEGSTFTLYLPLTYKPYSIAVPTLIGGTSLFETALSKTTIATVNEIDLSLLEQSDIKDDRDVLLPDDRILLIIENDVKFVPIMIDLAHEKGFKAVVALRGHAALAIAKKYRPDAITLDIRLPDIDGWAVLDLLKHDALTRHIPVHVISVEEQRQKGLQMGAFGYLEKPADKESLLAALSGIRDFVDRRVKKLLVVEDDEVQQNNIIELIGNGDVETTAVSTGKAALELLHKADNHYDCIVVDLKLPDMRGIELIEKIRKSKVVANLPVIVYTAKDLTRKEETQIKKLAETIIIKDVKSPERLLDETALFLHRAMENMPEAKRRVLKQLHQTDPVLAGKKVLVVDDDIRNIFSLTSVLEQQLMEVVYAENGKDGIQMLKDTADVGIVLMDVMMPEMDGYDTIRLIRSLENFATLPIIALTAKAMKGDRDKCIEAGASDYIAKPVDIDQLLSLLRVWLYR